VAWQRQQQGHLIDWLDATEARAHYPWAGKALGALWAPHDGAIDPDKLVQAQLADATARGARREQGPVISLLREGDRISGVQTATGSWRADQVVIAAGAWSGKLEGPPPPISVEPVRGQMASFPWPAGCRTSRIIQSAGVYIVPRGGGRDRRLDHGVGGVPRSRPPRRGWRTYSPRRPTSSLPWPMPRSVGPGRGSAPAHPMGFRSSGGNPWPRALVRDRTWPRGYFVIIGHRPDHRPTDDRGNTDGRGSARRAAPTDSGAGRCGYWGLPLQSLRSPGATRPSVDDKPITIVGGKATIYLAQARSPDGKITYADWSTTSAGEVNVGSDGTLFGDVNINGSSSRGCYGNVVELPADSGSMSAGCHPAHSSFTPPPGSTASTPCSASTIRSAMSPATSIPERWKLYLELRK